ncbi:MAG: hypothetical protein L6R42_005696 [Xanthoria sp. 1 TBL-2021]|nr:MAG: hypothetical protein L6R42_005696 [Xanthoria sp. 1 TBL-2021]
MSTNNLLLASDLSSSMPLVNKGKVRDIYQVNPSTLLFITTDRISAFDVALANGIPFKGALLTLISAHWSHILTNAIPGLRTHVLTLDLPTQIPHAQQNTYRHRSMQVHNLVPFKIEAIVRGYLTREAWDSYQKDGTVSGISIPAGLQESEAFPDGPIYTPSTKADVGEHDEDISEARAAEIVGSLKYAHRIKELSLEIYKVAHAYAYERGLILADTKFEFGLDGESGEVVLADEILTPESSRFWKKEGYEVGRDAEGVDKQFLRDWLVEKGLEGREGVVLPMEVVRGTEEKYREAFRRLVGKGFEEVVGR